MGHPSPGDYLEVMGGGGQGGRAAEEVKRARVGDVSMTTAGGKLVRQGGMVGGMG